MSTDQNCEMEIPGLRDERGFRKDTVYIFNDDGTVNYRAMVKPEHLYFNPDKAQQVAKKYGIPVEKVAALKISDRIEDTLEKGFVQLDTIEDSHVLMNLAGSRYLARLRGYKTVKARLVTASIDFAAVETEIVWIANAETGFQVESYTDGADASAYNTSNFARNYLTAIAFNRAFVRAVRNYLGVNIVSGEEVGPNVKREDAAREEKPAASLIKDPRDLCAEKISALGFNSFSEFVSVLVKKYVKNPDPALNESFERDPETWTSIEDLTTNDIHTVLAILSRKKGKK